jgi:hypothetical protein
VHIKFSTGSDGLAEFWHSTGSDQPVKYYSQSGQTHRGSTMMLRMGYYRDPAISTDNAVYHSRYKVGTSFDAVNPVK